MVWDVIRYDQIQSWHPLPTPHFLEREDFPAHTVGFLAGPVVMGITGSLAGGGRELLGGPTCG